MMSSATTSTPPLPNSANARSLRILYAEDMPELRDLVRIVLSREGHTVETVPNGAEAYERLASSSPGYDLLITDHHMPLMNGVELVERVRQQPFPGKIMVFSSEVSPIVHERYRQLAVDHILPKPVFPAVLREALVKLYHAPA